MVITGTTKVLGIIGSPVAHSLSPQMQNTTFAALGVDYIYVPFHVLPEDLATAVAGLRTLSVVGFNVTIPHKTAIVSLLDDLSPEADLIGAVNTVKCEERRLVGFNTDGSGFLRSLSEDLACEPQGISVLLIGAGGAARSALVALAGAGAAAITVVNRTMEKGAVLVNRFQPFFPATFIKSTGLNAFEQPAFMGGFDLLVNTTSVGMNMTSFPKFNPSSMKPSAVVYDMVYAPLETPLMLAARQQGLRTANGLGMLAAQGDEAFFIWTGRKPEQGVMRKFLLTQYAK